MDIDFGTTEKVIGIDLGTTNSLAAFLDLTGPKIIPGADGDKLVPSVVSINPSGEIVVGNAARELLITQPDRTVYSVKRLMGRGLEDIQEELKLFPFRIAPGSESVLQLEDGDVECAAAQIVNGDGSVFALIESVCQRCGRGFVDQPQNFEPRDASGVFRSLPLGIVEICGNRDDSF